MRIAISTRRISDPVHGEARDALSEDWSRYLHATWPEIVLLPLLNAPDRVARWASDVAIDAAILSNGNDWGECIKRDETERALVNWCRAHGRPVLGVCRGFQVLNALEGGTIEADIASVSGHRHVGVSHNVTLCSPRLIQIVGIECFMVNSYHHQGVTTFGLAPGLVPFALSDGAVVEGFYHPVEPILGIQWHPERPGAPGVFDKALISAFLRHGAFWAQSELER